MLTELSFAEQRNLNQDFIFKRLKMRINHESRIELRRLPFLVALDHLLLELHLDSFALGVGEVVQSLSDNIRRGVVIVEN